MKQSPLNRSLILNISVLIDLTTLCFQQVQFDSTAETLWAAILSEIRQNRNCCCCLRCSQTNSRCVYKDIRQKSAFFHYVWFHAMYGTNSCRCAACRSGHLQSRYILVLYLNTFFEYLYFILSFFFFMVNLTFTPVHFERQIVYFGSRIRFLLLEVSELILFSFLKNDRPKQPH